MEAANRRKRVMDVTVRDSDHRIIPRYKQKVELREQIYWDQDLLTSFR
jgi:hypothetical protein